MKKYLIAIDPSVNNLGYAIFNIPKKKLLQYDILHPTKRKDDYLTKSREMVNSIQDIIEKISDQYLPFRDVQLVTEIPQHFGSGGFLSRESGDVYKLTFVCGMIYGIMEDTIGYTPNEWKSQLPKCVVRARMSSLLQYKNLKLYGKKIIECSDCGQKHKEHIMDHNILDAISIGHFHLYGRV